MPAGPDESRVQVPALLPRNQAVGGAVAGLERGCVLADVQHRTRRARELRAFVGSGAEKQFHHRPCAGQLGNDGYLRRRRAGGHVGQSVGVGHGSHGDVAADVAFSVELFAVAGEAGQCREVSTRRGAPEAEGARVDAQFRRAGAQVADGFPDVEELGREGCFLAEAVLDARHRDAPGEEWCAELRHLRAVPAPERSAVDPDHQRALLARSGWNNQVEQEIAVVMARDDEV